MQQIAEEEAKKKAEEEARRKAEEEAKIKKAEEHGRFTEKKRSDVCIGKRQRFNGSNYLLRSRGRAISGQSCSWCGYYEPCKKFKIPEYNFRSYLPERTVWSGDYRKIGTCTCVRQGDSRML